MDNYFFKYINILCTSITILLLACSFQLITPNFLLSDDDYADDLFIRYDDFTYDDSIKTVLLHHYESPLTYPIIPLYGKEHLTLSFDDFRNDFREYTYTVIHCNADWNPSELEVNEYINGFHENSIIDYQSSINTDVAYTNYQVQFPNEDFQLTKSGNYIVMVYPVNGKENPILTKRFMVYENKVVVRMETKVATDVNEQFYQQEVDFSLIHEDYPISNPINLNVVLMQNYRWDNAITGLRPRFINDDELNYNYDYENVFDGNNEYRSFDIKSVKYQTIRVKGIEYSRVDRLRHVYLVPDENRSFKRYFSESDLNGNFLIKRNEGEKSNIEADYVKVHFSLPNISPLFDGSLYLFGKFSDWKFKKELKLDFDTISNTYNKEVLLKQGYYNYQYCFVKDGSRNRGDLSVIEGSHSETENDYSILVYHKPVNENYDKLVGFQTLNTGSK